MDKKINPIIKNYTDNELALNKFVVTSFARYNHLTIDDGFLRSFLATEDDGLETDINLLAKECTIEDVINIFELAIPEAEKTANGAVYTPKYIRDYIVMQVMHSERKPLNECLCADISCGCGAFLFTLADYLHNHTNMTYRQVIHNLYGVDISATSIGRAKVLLSLAALLYGEIINEDDFNLFCGDSLTFDFKSMPGVCENGGLDIVVGNPPYVRSKHIDDATKQHLPLWNTSKVGNADLYIPFFEIGMSVLNDNGLLGYITVNTFFKSVNARALRNYFSDNKHSLSIIDFGEQLVFKKKLAYTCLTFLSKTRSDSLMYVKADISDVESQNNFVYSRISYATLDNHRGWHLNRNEVLENIRLIENAGEALGDKYVIKNGIATLANDVFIFRPVREDEQYYYLNREGEEFAIEKGICRDIIKPNILKSEAEIPDKEEKIISPYDSAYNVITEDFFIQSYPCAYRYLLSCREILDGRDKGEGDYGAWYAFGRTQAIADSGRKLLFPYMSDLPHFVYAPQKDMMIYCGYAIYNESETELLFLKKVLESSVFDYYMKNTSKPYSTGYYSYAKNYVKSFGIYPFTEEQKQHLLSLQTKEEIDEYIKTIYGVAM
ncbi:MAG: N-6 DNA methylase [Muribaculaceae bacterium]|mgnify:FL=1|nr:N-6 DNA methylase [Muribaculaceae bacterium]